MLRPRTQALHTIHTIKPNSNAAKRTTAKMSNAFAIWNKLQPAIWTRFSISYAPKTHFQPPSLISLLPDSLDCVQWRRHLTLNCADNLNIYPLNDRFSRVARKSDIQPLSTTHWVRPSDWWSFSKYPKLIVMMFLASSPLKGLSLVPKRAQLFIDIWTTKTTRTTEDIHSVGVGVHEYTKHSLLPPTAMSENNANFMIIFIWHSLPNRIKRQLLIRQVLSVFFSALLLRYLRISSQLIDTLYTQAERWFCFWFYTSEIRGKFYILRIKHTKLNETQRPREELRCYWFRISRKLATPANTIKFRDLISEHDIYEWCLVFFKWVLVCELHCSEFDN